MVRRITYTAKLPFYIKRSFIFNTAPLLNSQFWSFDLFSLTDPVISLYFVLTASYEWLFSYNSPLHINLTALEMTSLSQHVDIKRFCNILKCCLWSCLVGRIVHKSLLHAPYVKNNTHCLLEMNAFEKQSVNIKQLQPASPRVHIHQDVTPTGIWCLVKWSQRSSIFESPHFYFRRHVCER